MTSYSVWVYLHIMLLVYWLGADLGVLLLARAARRAELSFAERSFALRMALVIDVTPRICFALMFPVGLHLSRSAGFVDLPAAVEAAAWVTSAAWIALLFALGANEGKPAAAWLNRVHLAFQAAAFLALAVIGMRSVLGEGPFPAGWLAWKVLLFALIFGASLGIDFAFRPIVPAFGRLATEGSSPEVERPIARAIDGAIRYVLVLYALLAVIAFLGVAKPF